MPGQNVILITGASSGIGKTCFDHLTKLSHVVYGTSRSDFDAKRMLQMDVTRPDSIKNVVNYILEEHRRIDVLINNAGISLVGAAEDTNITEARAQMETNFWGVIHMNNAILPTMRKQHCGKIIHIGSLAGLFAIPYQSYYTASKHALEGYCESLRMEVDRFDIHISLVEPGDFRSAISENRIIAKEAFSDIYRESFQNAFGIITKGEKLGGDTRKIALLMEKIIDSKAPKLRYLVGKPLDTLAARVKPYIPQRLFQWLIMNHYQI